MDGIKRFQDVLQELTGWVDSFSGLTDQDRAEGHAYLAGMARLAIERAFLCDDLDRPRFIRCMNPFSRWGLGNQDNVFLSADIRSDTAYVIKGNIGRCADFAVELLTGLVGDDNAVGTSISFIDISTIKTSPDKSGHFELHIGGQKKEFNYLATQLNTAQAGVVLVRYTGADFSQEHAGHVTIQKAGTPDEAAPRLDTHAVSDKWAKAAKRLHDQVMFLDAWASNWRKTLLINDVNSPTPKGSGFLPGQRNAFGQFNIADGEALVVTIKPIECRYWSIAVGHSHWLCTFDFRNWQNTLNSAQAYLSSDGCYHFVISATDPGVPNWIDTVGHSKGFMFLRWQGVAAMEPDQPQTSLVPLADIRNLFPADEPIIDAPQRLKNLKIRRDLFDRYFC